MVCWDISQSWNQRGNFVQIKNQTWHALSREKCLKIKQEKNVKTMQTSFMKTNENDKKMK